MTETSLALKPRAMTPVRDARSQNGCHLLFDAHPTTRGVGRLALGCAHDVSSDAGGASRCCNCRGRTVRVLKRLRGLTGARGRDQS